MTLAPAVIVAVLVFTGLVGAVIGSFLNVVVHRVPAGVSLLRESRCPSCDAPVRPWQNVPVVAWLALRGRCAACRAPISARYPLVELGTALAFVAVVWWGPGAGATALGVSSPSFLGRSTTEVAVVTAAYLYLAAISIALALIDIDTHRLPDSIVLPGYVVMPALFATACVLGAEWSSLLRAAIGGLALYLFYLVLRLVRPAGMGGGDVKLAGVLGLSLAWLGWGALAVGAFAAFLLGGVFGLALIAARRAGRKTAIPFGPFMLAGAWIGILAGEAIAGWYLGLFAAA